MHTLVSVICLGALLVASAPADAMRPAPTGPATAAPEVFPPRERVRAVRDYLRRRVGVESWALIDTRGRVRGWAPHRSYVSASVVKAMLLVAYLRVIGNRAPDAGERALLGPMITASDNDRADSVYYRVGDAALYRLARRARMRGFSVAGYWGNAHFSALDQARLFRRIDRMVPRRSRAYARRLLSSIVPWQRWGFARYARAAGYRTFFKGGWRSTESGRLVHEAALFERGRRRLSMAVLTDGNPSHEYGTATLRGVARRIFRARRARSSAAMPALRRAGLREVRDLAPGIALELVYRTRDNLTGRRLPGYCHDWAMLHEPAARSLARVQRYLRRHGRGLLVLDGYRPARASRALVRWAERSGHGDLVGTYIARRSRHNTGAAVDLTLMRYRDRRRLRMGPYDSLDSLAHTRNATGRVLRNRLALEAAMERFGFQGYWREWWHFEHRLSPARYLDLTLGC
ncbi:MAG TPA: M15 family metallopeptidase [Thermoleophilaceae bacterium]|nr:M15 family metallopeptidase [Thermoleophilaceae bacterium]